MNAVGLALRIRIHIYNGWWHTAWKRENVREKEILSKGTAEEKNEFIRKMWFELLQKYKKKKPPERYSYDIWWGKKLLEILMYVRWCAFKLRVESIHIIITNNIVQSNPIQSNPQSYIIVIVVWMVTNLKEGKKFRWPNHCLLLILKQMDFFLLLLLQIDHLLSISINK